MEGNEVEIMKRYKNIWGLFVSILTNEVFTEAGEPESMIKFLKQASGVLGNEKQVFLRQPSDPQLVIVHKRCWLRWLVRRLLALCHKLKECPTVLMECQITLSLIMKKAKEEDHQLCSILVEHYVTLLEGGWN